jgi:hypothetical protein
MTTTTAAPGPTTADTASYAASRRGFLAGAAVAAGAAGVAGLGAGAFSPAAAAGLPLVAPVWSEKIRRSFGVAVQPQNQLTTYGNVTVWPKYVADMNAHFIRGRYSTLPGLRDSTNALITQCRTLGLKWVMTLVPEDWSMTPAQLKAVLADIRDRAADICIAVEGINEPNTNRDGTPVRPDWAAASVAYQKVLWDFVTATPSMSHVAVLGPSVQMGGADPLVDFQALSTAGLSGLMTHAGMHSYPAGLKPDSKIDDRLGYVRTSWGSVPTWVSETGYTNSMAAPMVGPRPVPADIAAVYGPRSLLDYFQRGCVSTRFELLDEPDKTNAEPENSYGLVSCPSASPSTWTVKPEYNVMRTFLGRLRDSAAAYTPAPVPLQVTAPSTVRWILTGKSDKTATLHAYLNVSVWDIKKRVRINPAPVDVIITDRAGTRTVKVGATLTSIPLR